MRKLAMSADGTFMAAVAFDSSAMDIFKIDAGGVPMLHQSFSYSFSGTSGLSQVNNCTFDQYGNIYTTSDTFLACFTYDAAADEFSFAARIKEGDEGIGYMSGPKSITIDDAAGMGYVCSSASAGIAAVDVSSPGQLTYAGFTPCGAVHASALDAAGSYLYAVSSSEDALYAFSIDQ
jgi:6-phosphogluconolactonase (cycloisomerase 2 family)